MGLFIVISLNHCSFLGLFILFHFMFDFGSLLEADVAGMEIVLVVFTYYLTLYVLLICTTQAKWVGNFFFNSKQCPNQFSSVWFDFNNWNRLEFTQTDHVGFDFELDSKQTQPKTRPTYERRQTLHYLVSFAVMRIICMLHNNPRTHHFLNILLSHYVPQSPL